MRDKLDKKIMRNVYAIFVLRKIINPVSIKLYTALVFAWLGTFYVSLKNVFANMSHSVADVTDLYHFSLSSFFNTELVVQVLTIGIVVMSFWFMKDVVKNSVVPSLSHK